MVTQLVIGLLVIQISILIHEMGHALGILLFTNNEALVYLGPIENKRSLKFKIKRVSFQLAISLYGFCFTKNHENLTKRQTL